MATKPTHCTDPSWGAPPPRPCYRLRDSALCGRHHCCRAHHGPCTTRPCWIAPGPCHAPSQYESDGDHNGEVTTANMAGRICYPKRWDAEGPERNGQGRARNRKDNRGAGNSKKTKKTLHASSLFSITFSNCSDMVNYSVNCCPRYCSHILNKKIVNKKIWNIKYNIHTFK